MHRRLIPVLSLLILPLLATAEQDMNWLHKLALNQAGYGKEKEIEAFISQHGQKALVPYLNAQTLTESEIWWHPLESNAPKTYVEAKTPLMLAIEQETISWPLLECLRDQEGADLNLVEGCGRNLLHLTIIRGLACSFFESLLKKGVDPRCADRVDGALPLHLAAQKGRNVFLEQLIQAAPDTVNAVDKLGRNALIGAICEMGRSHIFWFSMVVQTLLEAGTHATYQDPNGQTALHHLHEIRKHTHSLKDTVALLVQYGALIDARDHEGYTPLMRAAQRGNLSVIKALLQNGANAHLLSPGSRSALSMALAYKEKMHQEASQDPYENCTLPLECYAPPAHAAVLNQDLCALGKLIQARHNGFNQKAQRINLRAFAQARQLELPFFGKDILRNIEPLLLAVKALPEPPEELIRLLVQGGADLEARDEKGRTALHIAAQRGLSNCVECLLSEGAQWTARTPEGHLLPLHYALLQGNDATVRVLLLRVPLEGFDCVAHSFGFNDEQGTHPGYWSCLAKNPDAHLYHQKTVGYLLQRLYGRPSFPATGPYHDHAARALRVARNNTFLQKAIQRACIAPGRECQEAYPEDEAS